MFGGIHYKTEKERLLASEIRKNVVKYLKSLNEEELKEVGEKLHLLPMGIESWIWHTEWKLDVAFRFLDILNLGDVIVLFENK